MDKIKRTWIQRHLTRETLELAIKISLGIILSILFADLIGMDFAPSTGVVALLSIQATRRETLHTAVRRVISFVYTVGLCYLVHEQIGMDTEAFALAVLLIVLCSVFLGWADTLSVNIVIAVHLFMMQKPFTQALILNETERLLIGMGIAFLVNWYTPNREKRYQKHFQQVDEDFSALLTDFSDFLLGRGSMEMCDTHLVQFRSLIESALRDANTFYNNTLHSHARYYLEYMTMREQECDVLENIAKELHPLHTIPASGAFLSDFILGMAHSVSAEQPVSIWEAYRQTTYAKMNDIPLPTTRKEFQEQAALFSMLSGLNEIIDIKRDFIESLTLKQKQRYWSRSATPKIEN